MGVLNLNSMISHSKRKMIQKKSQHILKIIKHIENDTENDTVNLFLNYNKMIKSILSKTSFRYK